MRIKISSEQFVWYRLINFWRRWIIWSLWWGF